eukprot:RCo030606
MPILTASSSTGAAMPDRASTELLQKAPREGFVARAEVKTGRMPSGKPAPMGGGPGGLREAPLQWLPDIFLTSAAVRRPGPASRGAPTATSEDSGAQSSMNPSALRALIKALEGEQGELPQPQPQP